MGACIRVKGRRGKRTKLQKGRREKMEAPVALSQILITLRIIAEKVFFIRTKGTVGTLTHRWSCDHANTVFCPLCSCMELTAGGDRGKSFG